jgi:hypothetical protein
MTILIFDEKTIFCGVDLRKVEEDVANKLVKMIGVCEYCSLSIFREMHQLLKKIMIL